MCQCISGEATLWITKDSQMNAKQGNTCQTGRLAFAVMFGITLSMLSVIGTDAIAAVSAGDQKCLNCHSMAGLSKSLGDGDKLSLHVAAEDYSQSVHSMMGCNSCHRDVDPAKHPAMKSIASAREYALEMSAMCRGCHVAKFEQYEGSIHASLVAGGDESAPVCSSCHDVHAQKPLTAYEPISGVPCKNCHEDIFDAYAGSVHGKARAGNTELDAGHIQAPICADCHQAHDVHAVAAGDRIKTACLGCHENALLAHDVWLPNSRLHLDMVACPACHSPMAERAVDLRLYDNQAQELVTESPGNPQFEEKMRAIDVDGDGLDPMELWQVVREANREGKTANVTLRGRLEVPDGVDAHQLTKKMDAVRDCDTCHQSGANPYQRVTISIAADDGRRIRYTASEDTLTSAVSVGAIGGFYTAGGTRIKLLDALLVLAIIAGLAIPVTHMSIRKYFSNRS